jgi:hypothetical protein
MLVVVTIAVDDVDVCRDDVVVVGTSVEVVVAVVLTSPEHLVL